MGGQACFSSQCLPMNAHSALVNKFNGFRTWALRFELRVAPTESQRLFALTVVIGVVCGLAAVLFHFSIRFAEGLLFDRAITAPDNLWIVWGVVTPALGGLAAGILLKYVFPNARGNRFFVFERRCWRHLRPLSFHGGDAGW